MAFTDDELIKLNGEMSMKPEEDVYREKRNILCFSEMNALLDRLAASEEVAEAVAIAHPDDENCGCSMCDLLKAWKASCGK